MSRTRLLLAGLAAATLLTGAALAASPAPTQDGKPAARRMHGDANKDGAVDKAEFVAARQRIFSTFDKNGDGTVTKAEFDSLAEERFAKLDKNGDGKLTREEMRGGHRQMRRQ